MVLNVLGHYEGKSFALVDELLKLLVCFPISHFEFLSERMEVFGVIEMTSCNFWTIAVIALVYFLDCKNQVALKWT